MRKGSKDLLQCLLQVRVVEGQTVCIQPEIQNPHAPEVTLLPIVLVAWGAMNGTRYQWDGTQIWVCLSVVCCIQTCLVQP